jgi:type I restriction-modification system DNA methylase subunit
MKLTKERAKKNLSKLIERFEREYSSGRIKEYNEEATKTSFVQPFLKEVLGWNVNDRDEVSPEEKISHGRVDYGLKVEGKIKIFIEAKPPRADLNRHIEQAVSYGYNRKGVPFVLLTDFEELKFFDVTVKPDSRNLRKGLKIDLQWESYLEQFDKIWWLSRESVVQGELDKLLLRKPKERVSVDKAILDDLKRWRESLAKDIFKNNNQLFHSGEPEKDADYLREITQKILDRIIFMRFCEDRRLVHFRSLKELFEERTDTVGTNTMVFLREEFRHYNIIFDSDLFRPQEWENNLAIDFKVMREIIEDTYHPYQFDVIPLEVLGNIYEQYLGYTIRLTDHQLKYELKPEVRKAGGVYYTPEYIVDYIVKNTVGKLLQELQPKKIRKLRILDPACGSGSFLIRAYEEMLNYYRNQKKVESKSKEKQSQLKLRDKDAEPHLTIREKSQILREHIFGVDIDDQAVEVTRLSLMLKMLEGEHGMVHGRGILPMLDKNIKCGNSLISGDTLELKKYFGDEWYKSKPFNWDEEFRKIMVEEGGFDAVIGNPPWVSLKGKHKSMDLPEEHLNYFIEKYKCDTYMPNIYELFIRRGLTLIKKGGFFSFIVPDRLCANQQFITLRKYILENFSLLNLWFKAPFPGIIADTVVFVVEKAKRKHNTIELIEQLKTAVIKIPQEAYYNTSDYSFFYIDNSIYDLFKKIMSDPSIINLNQKVLSTSGCGAKSSEITRNKINKRQIQILKGESIQRYAIRYKFWFEFTDKNLSGRTRDENKLGKKFKVLLRKTGADLIATFDDSGIYPEQSLYFLYTEEDTNRDLLLYILAILNSKLINCYYKNFAVTNRDSTPQLKNVDLDRFPMRDIDFYKLTDKQLHDDLVALVDVMLDLNKKNQTAKGSKKEQIQRQIDKTDKEIDEIVYKLYGITEKERKIIEG